MSRVGAECFPVLPPPPERSPTARAAAHAFSATAAGGWPRVPTGYLPLFNSRVGRRAR